MRYRALLQLVMLLLIWQGGYGQNASQNTESGKFLTRQGALSFSSDAPLKLIEAKSDLLYGAIDTADQRFAFSVTILSFEGFNSPLQRTHFNENYLESKKYPRATFTGKIVEKLDFSKPGAYHVRAKGKLNIHGVTQERIIKALIQIEPRSIIVIADFNVLLEEHDIEIPQIVHQKIAESIQVEVSATLLYNE